MIRVAKCVDIPPSLLVAGNTRHNHPDVIEQLIEDHKGKCYVCERICVTDYEIEHLQSNKNFDELRTSWNNLFFSCNYCNGKKLHYFDNILNPSLHNIEEIIDCNHIAETKYVDFDSNIIDNPQIIETISLLNRVFNGTGKMRMRREERFYEYFLSRILNFLSVVDKYISAKTIPNRNIVIEELGIEQEFLAFKYHILKQRPDLFEEFAPSMVWNKVIT
jgi:hypothetical protein